MVRTAPARLWALVAVELVLLAALVFIDYGWREPGQFGLRIDHQLLLGALYVVLGLTGVVWAVRRDAWTALAVQTVAPVAVYLWVAGLGLPLDAADHQDLVGRTRAEAMDALGERRGRWRSETGSADDSLETVLTFDGLDVHLVDERRITRIVPGDDPVPGSEYPPLVAAEQQDVVGRPYRTGYATLLRRGGIDYGSETDASGTYDRFNGVRVYYEGEQRVRRVTPPSDDG